MRVVVADGLSPFLQGSLCNPTFSSAADPRMHTHHDRHGVTHLGCNAASFAQGANLGGRGSNVNPGKRYKYKLQWHIWSLLLAG